MNTINFLDRMWQPVTDAMSPEFARRLIELRADDELQAQVEVLRQKANAGTLSTAEEAQYKDFVESLEMISILQSKARRLLASQSE